MTTQGTVLGRALDVINYAVQCDTQGQWLVAHEKYSLGLDLLRQAYESEQNADMKGTILENARNYDNRRKQLAQIVQQQMQPQPTQEPQQLQQSQVMQPDCHQLQSQQSPQCQQIQPTQYQQSQPTQYQQIQPTQYDNNSIPVEEEPPVLTPEQIASLRIFRNPQACIAYANSQGIPLTTPNGAKAYECAVQLCKLATTYGQNNSFLECYKCYECALYFFQVSFEGEAPIPSGLHASVRATMQKCSHHTEIFRERIYPDIVKFLQDQRQIELQCMQRQEQALRQQDQLCKHLEEELMKRPLNVGQKPLATTPTQHAVDTNSTFSLKKISTTLKAIAPSPSEISKTVNEVGQMFKSQFTESDSTPKVPKPTPGTNSATNNTLADQIMPNVQSTVPVETVKSIPEPQRLPTAVLSTANPLFGLLTEAQLSEHLAASLSLVPEQIDMDLLNKLLDQWILTADLSTLLSFLKSMKQGLPHLDIHQVFVTLVLRYHSPLCDSIQTGISLLDPSEIKAMVCNAVLRWITLYPTDFVDDQMINQVNDFVQCAQHDNLQVQSKKIIDALSVATASRSTKIPIGVTPSPTALPSATANHGTAINVTARNKNVGTPHATNVSTPPKPKPAKVKPVPPSAVTSAPPLRTNVLNKTTARTPTVLPTTTKPIPAPVNVPESEIAQEVTCAVEPHSEAPEPQFDPTQTPCDAPSPPSSPPSSPPPSPPASPRGSEGPFNGTSTAPPEQEVPSTATTSQVGSASNPIKRPPMVIPPPLIVPPPLAMPPPFFIPPPLQLPTVSHTRSLIPTPITKPTILKSPANTPASTTDTKPGSIEATGLQNTPSSEDDPPMLAPLPIQELNQTSSPNSLGQTSLVLCSSAETIANIMLHFDSALFCAVPAENLTTAAAVTSGNAASARASILARVPQLSQLHGREQKIAKWVRGIILLGIDEQTRAQLISHFIQLTQALRQLRDFSGCYAVIAGLNSPIIKGLTLSWVQVPASDTEKYRSLLTTFTPNTSGVIQSITSSITEATAEPCVPHASTLISVTLSQVQNKTPGPAITNFAHQVRALQAWGDIPTRLPPHLKAPPELVAELRDLPSQCPL